MGFAGKSSRPMTPGGLLGQQVDDGVTRPSLRAWSAVSSQKARPRSAISANRPSFAGSLNDFVFKELALVKAIK